MGSMRPLPSLGAGMPIPPGVLRFDAYHKGRKIGTHHVSVEPEGSGFKVVTKIDISVSMAFITLFEFRHDAVERWENGEVVFIESRTNDDGEEIRVNGVATPEGLRVVGPSGPTIAPAGILTSNSLWNPAFADQTLAVDVQHGGVIGISIEPLGQERVKTGRNDRQATKYKLVTPYMGGLLWYDDAGLWVKAVYEKNGEKVEYRLAG
jgi:uncharacterized protein DUF6134